MSDRITIENAAAQPLVTVKYVPEVKEKFSTIVAHYRAHKGIISSEPVAVATTEQQALQLLLDQSWLGEDVIDLLPITRVNYTPARLARIEAEKAARAAARERTAKQAANVQALRDKVTARLTAIGAVNAHVLINYGGSRGEVNIYSISRFSGHRSVCAFRARNYSIKADGSFNEASVKKASDEYGTIKAKYAAIDADRNAKDKAAREAVAVLVTDGLTTEYGGMVEASAYGLKLRYALPADEMRVVLRVLQSQRAVNSFAGYEPAAGWTSVETSVE